MTFWSLDNLARVTGGRVIAATGIGAANLGARVPGLGVSIDSRTIRPGEVFVAIRGERTDGHRYLGDAARGGCSALIVDDERAAAGIQGVPVLVVAETRRALADLARAYRRGLSGKVIAVGGSNGKTTTVRMLDAALSGSAPGRVGRHPRFRGSASVKSFNNDVGVPLTLLRAGAADDYVICEMGTNAPGEMAALSLIAEPDAAVLTSLGREHLEGLGDLAGVAREEASIAAGVREGGVVFVNADAPLLVSAAREAARTRGARVVTFGHAQDADVRLVDVRAEAMGGGASFRLADGSDFRVPMPGTHNASNACAAVAVARWLGADDASIAEGLGRVKGPEMRLERVTASGVEVLNDAYNANPESMLAAIETFLATAPAGTRRRVVVIGDMLELGGAGPAAHREIGRRLAREEGVGLGVFVGSLAHLAAAEAAARWGEARVRVLSREEGDWPERAARLIREGDYVLLKGSRGVGLERVLRAIEASGALHAGSGRIGPGGNAGGGA